jgi:hypothetical protein
MSWPGNKNNLEGSSCSPARGQLAGSDRCLFYWLIHPKIVLTSSHVRPALYLLLSYIVCHALVRVAPDVMRELSLSQRSFGSFGLKTTHRMIDDYLVKAPGFGLMFSERSVGIIWKTLMLPAPTFPKLVLIPINLSLPQDRRIQ